jgi:hypothetical protein
VADESKKLDAWTFSEAAPSEATRGPGLSTKMTVFISVATALLTSLLGPFLLEHSKDLEAMRQREKESQDRVIATQFEIVEQFNRTFWRYRQAAGFLMFDFVHGQSAELLQRHLKEFENASAEANREMPTEAFRARMYFKSIYVNNKLFAIWADVFAGVDNDISNRLIRDKSVPHPEDPESQKEWLGISTRINDNMIASENSLNEIFTLIGQTEIDKKMSPDHPLVLYRLPTQ